MTATEIGLPDPDQPLPTGDEKTASVRALFDTIAPRYDLVNRIMTFRLDVMWRRRAIRELDLEPGSLVVDLAAGTGDLCEELLRVGHRPVGADLSFGMLSHARTAAPLVQADGSHQPIATGSVDGLTCGFALRNFSDLEAVLAETARLVRPGGRIALLDKGEPTNPVLGAGHDLYFNRVVPLIGGALSNRDAYAYLPRSTAYLPPPPQLGRMVAAAGFVEVSHVGLSGGIAQLITATRSS